MNNITTILSVCMGGVNVNGNLLELYFFPINLLFIYILCIYDDGGYTSSYRTKTKQKLNPVTLYSNDDVRRW